MIFPCSSVSAGPTSALSAFPVEVFSPERMPSHAVLPIENREIHPTEGVKLIGNNLEVPWIYAPFIFAQVIDLQPFWNRTKKELIRKAMSVNFLRMRWRIACVAFAVSASSPNPATGLSIDKNLLSKTLGKSVNSNAQHTALTIPRLCDVVGVFAYGW
jgi:hypothetical protein